MAHTVYVWDYGKPHMLVFTGTREDALLKAEHWVRANNILSQRIVVK